MYGCRRLWVSEFLEDKAYYFSFLCIENSAPSSASAADAATSLRMVQVIWIAPLIIIGSASHGIPPRKK
jgi:hypothetical protein